MSWASSEWKNELSAVAVKKVEEMEKQRDRMSKEMKQNKQQVDAIEQMMSKQREKYEKERITHSSLVTDNAMLVESCDKLETKRHRLEHELSAKNNKLQNLQNNHDQTRRLLDEESNKAVAMENKVSQLQRIVRELEEKEKHNSTSVQQMKDALQDQHWKDVASLADERQTSEALKVELLRTRANAQYKDSICKSEENRAANDKIDNLEDKDIKTNIISSEKTCDQDQEMIYKQLQEKLSAAEFQIENINSKYDLLHKNYKKICNENKGMKSKSSSFANTQKSQNRRRFN